MAVRRSFNPAARPAATYAYYSRGLAYYDKGDDDRAIADYNEAIRLDPKFAQAYSTRGLAYYQKGDLDRASPTMVRPSGSIRNTHAGRIPQPTA